MLSIKKSLKSIFNGISSLKDRTTKIENSGNGYYQVVGKATNQHAKAFTVCSLTDLPIGYYLILGNVCCNVDGSSTILADWLMTGATGINLNFGRSIMTAGGGTNCWGLIQVTSTTNQINLRTYGYSTYSMTFTGSAIAIKLLTN